MRAVSKKKAKADRFYAMARVLVHARSQGWCEARLPGCTGRATHVHHVLPRSAGGTHDLVNLLDLCGSDHRWVHLHPVEARKLGLLASRYDLAEGGAI